jgi:hypothetical protein
MYRIVPDDIVTEQATALPGHALAQYLAVLDVLEITPWNGEPHHEANPDGAVRRWRFGAEDAGLVVYLIDERDQPFTCYFSCGSVDPRRWLLR